VTDSDLTDEDADRILAAVKDRRRTDRDLDDVVDERLVVVIGLLYSAARASLIFGFLRAAHRFDPFVPKVRWPTVYVLLLATNVLRHRTNDSTIREDVKVRRGRK